MGPPLLLQPEGALFQVGVLPAPEHFLQTNEGDVVESGRDKIDSLALLADYQRQVKPIWGNIVGKAIAVVRV